MVEREPLTWPSGLMGGLMAARTAEQEHTNSTAAWHLARDRHRMSRQGCITISQMLAFVFLTACHGVPLISAGYLYHCSGFAHLCVLVQQAHFHKIWRVAHGRAVCKNAFHCLLSPPAHSRIRTWSHIHTWLCTLTHAHTCTQSWLLKVLTWAMPLCQLFPVGRLSTCLIFHACAEFLCLSKLTVDADFIVSNKVFHLNPAPTHTILFQRAPLIMQHIIQSWVHTCKQPLGLPITGLINALENMPHILIQSLKGHFPSWHRRFGGVSVPSWGGFPYLQIDVSANTKLVFLLIQPVAQEEV